MKYAYVCTRMSGDTVNAGVFSERNPTSADTVPWQCVLVTSSRTSYTCAEALAVRIVEHDPRFVAIRHAIQAWKERRAFLTPKPFLQP